MKPIKIVPLKGAKVESLEAFEGRKFCFSIKVFEKDVMYFLVAKDEEERALWMEKLVSNSYSFIGMPQHVKHQMHIIYDEETGSLKGIPQEWNHRLQASGFEKEDYQRNSMMILNILKFEDTESDFQFSYNKRVTMQVASKHFDLAALCSQENPVNRFASLKKIGEGSFGTVYMATDKNSAVKEKVGK